MVGLPMADELVVAPLLALEVDVLAEAGGDGGGYTCLPWLLVMVGGLGTGLMEMPLEKVAGLPLPATILTVGDTSMNTGDTCVASGTGTVETASKTSALVQRDPSQHMQTWFTICCPAMSSAAAGCSKPSKSAWRQVWWCAHRNVRQPNVGAGRRDTDQEWANGDSHRRYVDAGCLSLDETGRDVERNGVHNHTCKSSPGVSMLHRPLKPGTPSVQKGGWWMLARHHVQLGEAVDASGLVRH